MNNSIDSSDINSSNQESQEEIEEKVYKYNGDEIIKKYFKGKFLGKGGFAKCYEMKSSHNKKTYAAKIIYKKNLVKQSAKSKLKSEIKIHKSLFHSNVVKFEHVFEDSSNVYILLELCHNNTLNEMLKKRNVLTEIETKYFLDQILKGVKFLHKNKIIHRDLKLGNLFLNDKMELKIGDFGLATSLQFDGERKHTVCGTPNYIAPEVLEGKAGHSFEVDFWAIGVIIYTLLIGKPPFETSDVNKTYQRIQANNYSFPDHIFISDDAKDFVTKILVSNPLERLTLDKMRLHPFMSKHPIPIFLPEYVLDYPPNSQFYRKYRLETLKIDDINELSYINDAYDFDIYLNEIKEFASRNVKQIPVEINDEKAALSHDKLNKIIQIKNKNEGRDYNSFELQSIFLVNKNLVNLSQNKENHKLLQKNRKELNINDLCFVDRIIDYSQTFGLIYITNKNLLGVLFNDKSCLYKIYQHEELNYEIKKSSTSKNKHDNLQTRKTLESFTFTSLDDVPVEIRMKNEILTNYENYLKNSNEVCIKKENSKIYVKKIIIREKCYLIKLSNNTLQVNNICYPIVNILRQFQNHHRQYRS